MNKKVAYDVKYATIKWGGEKEKSNAIGNG
jgi:hypothetical protein